MLELKKKKKKKKKVWLYCILEYSFGFGCILEYVGSIQSQLPGSSSIPSECCEESSV